MDKTYLIANWKMHFRPQEAVNLAKGIAKGAIGYTAQAEVVLCPSFDSILQVSEELKNSSIKLGAQDCFWESEGSYTGEISPKFLADMGVKYVILGHSERRQNLGETSQQVGLKVRAALANGLVPILCVGETFEERHEGRKDFVIMQQLNHSLHDVKLLTDDFLIVAYEPVWVIGSGQAVDPEEAEHTSQVIKQTLFDIFGTDAYHQQTSVIYGGSVNPDNFKSFLDQPTIKGALVGTASLKTETFIEMIKQTV